MTSDLDSNPAVFPRLARESWRSLLSWIIATALGFGMLFWLVGAIQRPANSFVAHYAASRLVLEGADVARFYEDEWFMIQVARFEPTVTDIYHANLPTMSLVLLPLSPFEYPSARMVWTLFNVLLLLAAVLWAMKMSGVGPGWAGGLLCLVFLFQPVHANLFHGSMYIMALALLVVAWWAYRGGGDPTTGVSLGVLFAAKTAALMYWPLFFVQRRWKVLGWGAATVAAIAVLSLPVVGTAAWGSYFDRASRLLSQPSLTVTAYQTVPGWVRHHLIHDPQWNPEPLTHLPTVATGISWLAGLGMLGVSAVVAWHRRNDLVFGSFAVLSLMLSPVSTDSHYTMALLPIVILTAHVRGRMRSLEGLLLIAGALLIAADLPYSSPRVADGIWALFAYPKLYGAFMLWALCLWLAVREVPSRMDTSYSV